LSGTPTPANGIDAFFLFALIFRKNQKCKPCAKRVKFLGNRKNQRQKFQNVGKTQFRALQFRARIRLQNGDDVL
jgi:hypothetical protein